MHGAPDIGYPHDTAAVMTIATAGYRDIPTNRRPVERPQSALASKGYTPLPPFDPAKHYAEAAAAAGMATPI